MGLPKIEITDKMRQEAIQYSDVSHTDTDMDRDANTREVDALVGEIAERVAARFFRTNGYSVSPSTSHKHDLQVNGSKIEVKGRKTWDYARPDLLVRTKFDLACDIYLQVDLHLSSGSTLKANLSNLDHAVVVGYATKDKVKETGDSFNQGFSTKDNPTLKVNREDLTPPSLISKDL